MTIADDYIPEASEIFHLTLSNPQGAGLVGSASAVGTITDYTPVISLAWRSKTKTSDRQNCVIDTAAAPPTTAAGICEGDVAEFIINSDKPAPTDGLVIRLGRLIAGKGSEDYGLTNPTNHYQSDSGPYSDYSSMPVRLTMPAGMSSLSYDVPFENHFGSQPQGRYFLEVLCPDFLAPANACRARANEPPTMNNSATYTATAGIGYRFADSGNSAGSSANCTATATIHGDDASECLLDIRPVTRPTLSIARTNPTAPPPPAISMKAIASPSWSLPTATPPTAKLPKPTAAPPPPPISPWPSPRPASISTAAPPAP